MAADCEGSRNERKPSSARRGDKMPVTETPKRSWRNRGRIMFAAAWVFADRGPGRIGIRKIAKTAGISEEEFRAEFADAEDCLVHAFAAAGDAAAERSAHAFGDYWDWRTELRSGLTALLSFFDEQPQLAALCLSEYLVFDDAAGGAREHLLERIEGALEKARTSADRPPAHIPPRSLIAGAWWLAHEHRRRPGARPLLELLNPLMAMLVEPYEGREAARTEMSIAPPPPARGPEFKHPYRELGVVMTRHTVDVLQALSGQPGMSNREVADCAGINSNQASEMLRRWARLGLIENL